MKIILIFMSIISSSCFVSSTSNNKVIVRGDPDFLVILKNENLSIKEIEQIGLNYKKLNNPKKTKVFVGPVVAIVDGMALLTSPNKDGEFGLHGVFVDLESKQAIEKNITAENPKIFRVKEFVKPLVWEE
jgi:hypothetical protein